MMYSSRFRTAHRADYTPARSQRPKQKVPEDVDSRMHERRSKNRSRLTTCPPVKESRDGGEDHVSPVWKTKICNMGESKQNRRSNPSGPITVSGTREAVLQQPSKQELFRPRRKKQNSKG